MIFTIFGENLKNLRNSYQLSQVKLSRCLFLKSHNGVARWETGRSGPTVEKLTEIADFFAVSTDWLLGRSSVMYTDDMVSLAEEKVLDFLYQVPKNNNAEIFYEGYLGYFLKQLIETLPHLPYGDSVKRKKEYNLEVRANLVVLFQILFVSYINEVKFAIHQLNQNLNVDEDRKVLKGLIVPFTTNQIDTYGDTMEKFLALFTQKEKHALYHVIQKK